jgi:trimeric autotransporter adhesin
VVQRSANAWAPFLLKPVASESFEGILLPTMKSCSSSFLSAVVCLMIAVFVSGCGSSSPAGSSGGSTPPPAQTPLITSVAPMSVPAGSAAMTLTVTGSGFLSTSVVRVNGTASPTTYVSPTELTATVPASDLVTGAVLQIAVSNGSTSTASNASAAALEVDNPVPVITGSSPLGFLSGATPTSVTVTGSGFVPATVVQVNGTARATTYIDATHVSVSLTASDLASSGSVALVAVNPAPGGGTSAGDSLPVSNPAPGIITVAPSTVAAGTTAATTVAVTGTNFIAGSVAQVNGSSRPTTVVSATQLDFQLTPADQAAAGDLQISVLNPAPGGGASSGISLLVSNPKPGLASLAPSTVAAGTTTATAITVTGSNFIAGSVVQVNGSSRPTMVVSATQLSFQLTVADQAAAGNLLISVLNPAPGGGASASVTFAVTSAPGTPIISSVSPTQFNEGSCGSTITVFGPNLLGRDVIYWNGASLPTSVGYGPNGSYLTATVQNNFLATAGPVNITVESFVTTPLISNTLSAQVVIPPPPVLTSISPATVPINQPTTVAITGDNFTAASTVAVNGVAIPAVATCPAQRTINIPASTLSQLGINTITVSNESGTSAPSDLSAYVPIINNSMVYDPANGLFYLSVPSAAGAPYGNTVVSVDPLTGALGTPIPVGSEPNRMAITSDGRYLWVALDGASAVRKVDLTAGTAGLQFSTGGSSDDTVAALAALPGATDSVVVSTYYGGYTEPTAVSLAIYDSGVPRSSTISLSNFPWALIVDGTRNEIYGPGNGQLDNYDTYGYDANGVTVNSSTSSSLTYAANNTDDVQIVDGRMYTSYGQVVNPESGSLLGTFYSTGTTTAQGSVTVDTALGKAFILEGSSAALGLGNTIGLSPAQIGAFNISDLTATSSSPISVSIPTYTATYQYAGPTGSRLTRWGTDGLAFRGTGGFVSLRSSLVKDLSAVNADLAVAITQTGANTTGGTTAYTATVTNNGPSAASNIALTAWAPSSGVVSSVTPSTGTCSTTGSIICDLGGLANGASATVIFNVLQPIVGSATMTVQASASETDPIPSNNQATSTISITGGTYNLAPVLSAISPAAILSGSSDTFITVAGTGFSSSSTVLLNGTALSTSFVSNTQLSAIVPAADLTNLGWASIAVSSPSPGGGISSSVPLSVFSALSLGANHILYDPYSRKIMAAIGAGTSSVTGNSILAITPDTNSVGTAVPIGGTPTTIALTSDGQILYALVPGSTTGSIARFNMLTQQPDFTVSGFQATGYNVGLRDIATQPGSENTVAVDEGENPGISIFDFNTTTQTTVRRGVATGEYTGTCLAFPNASSLFATDLYTSGTLLELYSVSPNGLVNGTYPYWTGAVLQNAECYKLDGGILYGQGGGVANIEVTPAVQLGTFEGMPIVTIYGAGIKDFEPDTSLGLSFYLTDSFPNGYSAIFDSISAFDIQTFMPSTVLPLPIESIEGNTDFTGVDLVRWGQDGLAALTSSGNVYLVRGAAVVPQLLNANSPAILSGSSSTSITHGAGNTDLTLTGGSFVPGVAVLWNGSYRSTTIMDSAHLSVAIPASDLANPGTATITAVNPGAAASASLSLTIN